MTPVRALACRLDRVGFSVRADWPDGSHDLFGWRRNWYAAWRMARRARTYWQAGPVTPHVWAVVVMTRRQVHGHPRACRELACQRGSVVFNDPTRAATGTRAGRVPGP